MKRILAIMLMAALLLTGAAAETDERQSEYEAGWLFVQSGRYLRASEIFRQLGDYEDSAQLAYLLGVSAYAGRVERIGSRVLAYEFHDQWGVIDLNTYTLTEPTWDSVGKLDANGLAKVRQYGQYGYINAQGKTVIACEWDDISNFLNGLCTVKKNKLFGMMNAAGEVVTPAEWRMLGSSQSELYAPVFTADGRMVVQNQARKYGLMDKNGSVLGEVCWDTIPDLSQELPLVLGNNRYGFIDHDGNVVIEPQYRSAMPFSEGLAAVSTDGMMIQFIDRDNNVIVPPVYVDVQSFSGGVAHVKLPGKSWQIIDKTGQLIYFVTEQIRADYDAAVEKMAAEDYVIAHNLFAEIIGYKDSYARFVEARQIAPLQQAYERACMYLEVGQFTNAADEFANASGYKDADEQRIRAEAQITEFINIVNIGEYGFALTTDGFYESTNQGVPNSFAMCRVDFATETGCIYIDYYYSAEVGKDIALISELDAMLKQDSATDSEHVAAKPGARRSSGMQTVKIDVPDGNDHYLTIKFKKNPKTDVDNDSFQFRVRFK